MFCTLLWASIHLGQITILESDNNTTTNDRKDTEISHKDEKESELEEYVTIKTITTDSVIEYTDSSGFWRILPGNHTIPPYLLTQNNADRFTKDPDTVTNVSSETTN
ncbi:hypothetical protein HZH66_013720 [Vespula vulgaris]|uniref:Uncharacterized protein n=1 Tax=Vespula vulgaris TaxID=7454 RepID=A0A834J550_VESVU|nr:hypothetical protein HZH66_013720 [Vespula vulgaris]